MNAVSSLRKAVLGKKNAPENEQDESLLNQAVSTALAPVRVATSRPAIKVYLGTLLFLVTSAVLLSISTTAYFVFYYRYIPQIGLERTIYLQYGTNQHPHATIALDTQSLITQQPYDVDIILHMPRTPSNLAAGNFMLDLSLLTDNNVDTSSPLSYVLNATNLLQNNSPLYRSRRPTILPYTSQIVSVSHTFLHLPWHLLSMRDLDSSTLEIPMFERLTFPRGRTNIPSIAHLEIQSQIENCPPPSIQQQVANLPLSLLSRAGGPVNQGTTIQIYDAKIVFRARFQGLRYIIYNHRVAAFGVFTTLFYVSSMASMAIVWGMIASVFHLRHQADDKSANDDSKEASKRKIKSEKDAEATELSTSSKSRNKKIKNEPSNREEAAEDADKKALYSVKPEEDTSDSEILDRIKSEAAGDSDGSTTFPVLGRNAQPLRYSSSEARTSRGNGINAEAGQENGEGGRNDEQEDEDDTPPIDAKEDHDASNEEEEEDHGESAPLVDTYDQRRDALLSQLNRQTEQDKNEDDEDEDEDDDRRVDSGLGTSMESEAAAGSATAAGLVRRRSGRGTSGRRGSGGGSGSRNRAGT